MTYFKKRMQFENMDPDPTKQLNSDPFGSGSASLQLVQGLLGLSARGSNVKSELKTAGLSTEVSSHSKYAR
jgi:hypothetical protein